MPTIRNQLRAGGPIGLSALALAGWCSYLVGVADDGSEIRLASDPDLENARSVARQSLANPEHFLTYARVFGDDLVQDARFRTAFVGSLNELRSRGVRATLSSVLNVT
jgi:mannitol 2-dehydrogenase